MAKPAFIYAFDNLGPERFTELCGLLLGARYKGFLLGGVGADGGVDGEIDELLGEWNPETVAPLISEVIQPGRLVVFQFKHKVVARVGQATARSQLLNLFKCSPTSNKQCELHRNLITNRNPTAYVLVTNVEANSEFRSKFVEQCQRENPNIIHYQVIGLDELENWIANQPELRHLYFPTIFGESRFNLKVKLSRGLFFPYNYQKTVLDEINVFQVSVLNIGIAPSYVQTIWFETIVDGTLKSFSLFSIKDPIMQSNPKRGEPIEPGRAFTWSFPQDALQELKKQGKEVFPVEIQVLDEIGNTYTAPISDELRKELFS